MYIPEFINMNLELEYTEQRRFYKVDTDLLYKSSMTS